MTQNISFDFIVSNFIGTGNSSFTNDLSKLKYPSFQYMNTYTYNLKQTNGNLTFKLQFESGNKYYFIDSKNRKYQINKLDYNSNGLLSQSFKYNKISNIILSIQKQGSEIKCFITKNGPLTDQTILQYLGKSFLFQSNEITENKKNKIEMDRSSYNNTFIYLISKSVYNDYSNEYNGYSIYERVQKLSCHLTDDSQQQYYNLISSEGRKTLMAISGSSLDQNRPVIFIDITSSNGTITINNIYINDGNAKFFYPNNNGSIQLIGTNHNVLRINKKENCLFNCMMLLAQNDLTINGDYKDFNVYFIGVRKIEDLVYSEDYISPFYTSCSNLKSILNSKYKYIIGFTIEVFNSFGNSGKSYYIMEISVNHRYSVDIYSGSNHVLKYSATYDKGGSIYIVNNVACSDGNYDIFYINTVFCGRFVIQSISDDWSKCRLYTKNNEIARHLFPHGYFSNNVERYNEQDQYVRTSDFEYEINGEKFNSFNEITLRGVAKVTYY